MNKPANPENDPNFKPSEGTNMGTSDPTHVEGVSDVATNYGDPGLPGMTLRADCGNADATSIVPDTPETPTTPIDHTVEPGRPSRSDGRLGKIAKGVAVVSAGIAFISPNPGAGDAPVQVPGHESVAPTPGYEPGNAEAVEDKRAEEQYLGELEPSTYGREVTSEQSVPLAGVIKDGEGDSNPDYDTSYSVSEGAEAGTSTNTGLFDVENDSSGTFSQPTITDQRVNSGDPLNGGLPESTDK